MRTARQQQHSRDLPAISARGIAAGYGDGDVITDIDLTVRTGRTFGLIGLNGAGKTTFIKILLGLLEPSSGTIEIEGDAVSDTRTKQKIVYLPEKFEPPVFLTGYEFVRFALTLYGQKQPDQNIRAAAERLAFDTGALGRRTTTYSKGMKQKIGLMSVFLTEAPILILDEPMSGLDPLARACVKDEILNCRKKGMTVFLSSHILADMDEICDDVGVIDDGLLKFTGTPKTLKTRTKEDYLERAFLNTIGKRPKTLKE